MSNDMILAIAHQLGANPQSVVESIADATTSRSHIITMVRAFSLISAPDVTRLFDELTNGPKCLGAQAGKGMQIATILYPKSRPCHQLSAKAIYSDIESQSSKL